jgi:hypothetical protein
MPQSSKPFLQITGIISDSGYELISKGFLVKSKIPVVNARGGV